MTIINEFFICCKELSIMQFIEDNYLNSEEFEQSFNKLLMSSYKENFKHVRNEKKFIFLLDRKDYMNSNFFNMLFNISGWVIILF
jgi:hypothetical protein